MYSPDEEDEVSTPAWHWWFFFVAPLLEAIAAQIWWCWNHSMSRRMMEFAYQLQSLGAASDRRARIAQWVHSWLVIRPVAQIQESVERKKMGRTVKFLWIHAETISGICYIVAMGIALLFNYRLLPLEYRLIAGMVIPFLMLGIYDPIFRYIMRKRSEVLGE